MDNFYSNFSVSTLMQGDLSAKGAWAKQRHKSNGWLDLRGHRETVLIQLIIVFNRKCLFSFLLNRWCMTLQPLCDKNGNILRWLLNDAIVVMILNTGNILVKTYLFSHHFSICKFFAPPPSIKVFNVDFKRKRLKGCFITSDISLKSFIGLCKFILKPYPNVMSRFLNLIETEKHVLNVDDYSSQICDHLSSW